MKTVTLIYGSDDTSKAALNEIEYIQNKYSDIILTHKIKIITQIDTEYREIDATIHKYPTLFFIDDLKVEKIEGYNLENLNSYWEYFLDNFGLRDSQPFNSWIWNETIWRWEPPVPINNTIHKPKWNEEQQTWVSSVVDQPYPSWEWNEELDRWLAPVSELQIDETKTYNWDEGIQDWVVVENLGINN